MKAMIRAVTAASFLVGKRRASGGISAMMMRAAKKVVPATRPRCSPEIARRWAMPAACMSSQT